MMVSLRSNDLRVLRAGLPKGAKVGVTSGCFDLFHYLHLVYLERCARLCGPGGALIVGVDSDDLVRSVKGPNRPNIPETHRQAVVDALKCVTATFIMGSVADFGQAVSDSGADFIFKNDAFKDREVEGAGLAKVVIVPDIDMPDSTSKIVQQIVARGLSERRRRNSHP